MLAAASLGCTANHLVFTTYTKVGLDVSTTNGQMVDGVFGYKRFEGAIIPVDHAANAGVADPKMASVFAGVSVRNSWINGLDLAQVFGTGEAAKNLASGQATGAIAEILDLTKNGNTPPANPAPAPAAPPANPATPDGEGDDE